MKKLKVVDVYKRQIIYYAKTGLEATDHFVPKLLEKYCQDNGYEIVAMLSERCV